MYFLKLARFLVNTLPVSSTAMEPTLPCPQLTTADPVTLSFCYSSAKTLVFSLRARPPEVSERPRCAQQHCLCSLLPDSRTPDKNQGPCSGSGEVSIGVHVTEGHQAELGASEREVGSQVGRTKGLLTSVGHWRPRGRSATPPWASRRGTGGT